MNINLDDVHQVAKHNKATVLAVSKMSQNKIMLKTLNGNISSTMYAAVVAAWLVSATMATAIFYRRMCYSGSGDL